MEECNEYFESHAIEELADIIEVIYTLGETQGATSNQIEESRIQKRHERGGFQEKIFLEEVV